MHASPTRGRRGRPEETLLIEWPEDEAEPTKIHRSPPLSVNLANYLILEEFDCGFLTQYN
jgi:hypothetical protein